MSSVSITAFSRVHLTLLDLNGAYGRINGGLGFALQEPILRVRAELGNGTVEVSRNLGLPGDVKQRTVEHSLSLSKKYNKPAVRLVVDSEIPSHVGLGSRTALLLAFDRSFFCPEQYGR